MKLWVNVFKNIPWARSNRTRKLGKSNNNNKIPSNLRIEVNMNTFTKIKNLDSHELRITPWSPQTLAFYHGKVLA